MNIPLTFPRRCFFCESFLLFMLHVDVYCAVSSVPCSLVVTCWEMADLLAVLSHSQKCPSLHQNLGGGWRRETGLSPPVKYCTDRSKAVLLLWIFYVFFWLVFVMPLCASVYLCRVVTWPLGSRLWCITVSLSLSHWYPRSGVVLDCIDSWSFHPYLL